MTFVNTINTKLLTASKYTVVMNFNFPTIYESAVLSADAYNITSSKMPPGWNFLAAAPQNPQGYFGKCYTKNWNTSNAMIAFAHRGTVVTVLGSIISDINILLDLTPGQCYPAYNFVVDCFDKLGQFDKKGAFKLTATITHVGHSLGAILADSMSGMLSVIPSFDNYHRTCTFENPGSMYAVLHFWGEVYLDHRVLQYLLPFLEKYGEAFQAGVNVIDSCRPLVSNIYRITSVKYTYNQLGWGVRFPLAPKYNENFTYYFNNTLDQHRMDPILDLMDRERFEYTKIESSTGLQSGYIEYLNPQRELYWKGYFLEFWKQDSFIRDRYHNNYAAFEIDGFKTVQWTYEEAKKVSSTVIETRIFSVPSITLFSQSPARKINNNVDSDENDIADMLMNASEMIENATVSYCPLM